MNNSTQFGSNVFGGTNLSTFGTTTASSNPFGVETSSTQNVFGNFASNNPSASAFASSVPFGTGMGIASTSDFGVTSGSSVFGNPSISGAGKTQTSSVFDSGIPSTAVFGGPTAASSVFGGPTAASSAFGGPSAVSSVFGGPSAGSSVFGSSTVFGNPVTGSGNTFGTSTSGFANVTPSAFGASNSTPTSSALSFGVATTQPFGTQIPNQPVFGTQSTSSAFGQQTSSNTLGINSLTNTSSEIPNIFGASNDTLPGTVLSQTAPMSAGFMTGSSGQTKSSVLSGIQTDIKKSEGSSTGSPNIFGGTQTYSTSGSDRLFGKSPTRDTQDHYSNQFDIPPSSSSNLFGKPSAADSKKYLLVKSQATTLNVSGQSTSEDTKMGSVGLFGQSIKEEVEEKRIFGKSVEPGKVKKEVDRDQGQSSSSHRALFQNDDQPSKKRVIKREQDEIQEKRGRTLFSRATAGIFGAGRKVSDRESRPLRDRVEDLNRDTALEKRKDMFDKYHSSKEDSSQKDDISSQSRKRKEVPTSSGRSEESREDSRRLRVRRMSSAVEDVDNKVAIVAKGIPARYNKVPNLRRHFSRFGIVRKVYPNINKNSATIHFDNHNSAVAAKHKGQNFVPGEPRLQLFWSSYNPTPQKPSSWSSTVSSPEDSKRSSSQSPKRKSRWETSDVDDELAGMAGTSDIAEDMVKDLKRPKDVKRHPESKEVKKHSEPKEVIRRVQTKARSHSPKPVTGRISPSNSPVKSKSDTGSIVSLFQTVCKSVWEKKQLLDLRDKLLRQAVSGDKKKSDLATAKAFIGTCPDMCPEKERYDRQETRRLSIYEMIPGTENIPNQTPQIDHSRAVKEYSRSSADQTEPLQHELRPEPVLMMTMVYLLREIADRGEEERWADWYDFLWNRTRGIRKDITQQQLCNRNVVELIEKCARYHIYCSHRLCEQDMMVFDSKINDENLTKCLQTLKEMYYDLEKNQLVFCPNEAEFRGYMVLMNLNQGDTLREVQELRPVVRESAEIKFALRVYSALNSHNYVRFFRMVKQATFLQACIVHRYFTQVRSQGLRVLMKALGKNNRYPLSHLKNIFSFENVQEAGKFCMYYGFTCKDDYVTIDNRDFMEPEMSVPPTRSISLIESKLLVPVGQIINGQELPMLNLPVPVNSFDKDGKLIPKSEILKELDTSVKVAQETSVPVSKPSTSRESGQSSSTTIPSNYAIKGVARELFLEVIAEYVEDIANEPIQIYKALIQTGYSIGKEILIGVQDNIIRQVCQDVLTEIEIGQQKAKEQKEREERQQKEKERKEMLDKMAEIFLNDFINETCSEESKDVANTEFRLVQDELHKQRIKRLGENLRTELLSEVISEMVDEIASEVYEKDVIQRLEELHDAEKAIRLKRAGGFFYNWKTSYQAKVKLKRAMLAFPCGPTVADTGTQIQSLLPERKAAHLFNRTMFVSQNSRLTLESATDLEKRNLMLTAKLSLVSLYQQLQLLKSRQPLDIIRLIQPELLKIAHKPDLTNENKENHVLWKLVLSMPDGSNGSQSTNQFCNWLNSKFKRGVIPDLFLDDYQGEILSLYNTTISRGESKQPLHFGVCVQSISGTLQEDDERDNNRVLLGCGGLFFVLPLELSSSFNQGKIWSECLQRLASLIETKPMCPSLPLVIICNSSTNEMIDIEELYENLNITSYIEEGLVNDVHIMVIHTTGPGQVNVEDVSLTDQLSSCVQWLGKRIPETPAVNSKSLVEFVNDVILEEYFTPVLQDLHVRKQKKYLHQSPEILINFYNSVIEYLLQVISSPILSDISWPVPEFTLFSHKHDQPPVYWNTVTHLQYLSHILSDLELPEFYYQDNQTDSWDFVCQDVWSYVSMVTGSDQGAPKIEFISRVKNLLKHVQEDFEETCYLMEGEDNCEPTYINMPWTDLIQACIDYKIKTLNYIDPNTARKEIPEELKVYYTDKTYTEFSPPDIWKSALIDTDSDQFVTVTSTFYRAVEKSRIEKYEDTQVSEIEIVKPVSVTKDLIFSNSILDKIRIEQKDASDFEKYLESAAKDDLSTLTTDFNQSMDCDSNVEELNESVMDRRIREYYDDILQNGTISERLSTLQEKMESDRLAGQLFEQKLEYLLNS